jgi:membrane fusion protein (multidrug efflux system)
MKRNIALGTLIVLLLVGLLGGIKGLQISTLIAAGKAFVQPPETVSSFVARQETWANTLQAIGSVVAVQGVEITPEVGGLVAKIAFESGAGVKQGDVLIELDSASERAQLRAMEAQAELARLNAERLRLLRAENTVSQADLDAAEASLKQLQASAEAIFAAIEKKIIRAPFAGMLGIRQVNLGEYLDPGEAIVSLQSLAPVFVRFSLPQQELSRLKTGMAVLAWADTYPGRQFEGRLTAINPDLNASTRSVPLQATFENAGQELRPGMFVRVEVVLASEEQLVVIPSTAVLSAPYGNSVYLIEPGTNAAGGFVVRQQFVRTGRSRGDFVSVETGVKPGQTVASAGLFKLRNGMAVAVNNEIVPPARENPQPPDK